MRGQILLAGLFLTLVIIISGCTSYSPGGSSSNKRNDFGCWPPSCSFLPENSRGMCEDWKAGKTVNWFDCSLLSQYPACQKLCEYETQNRTTPNYPTNGPGNYSGYPTGGNQNNSQQLDTGIPKADPEAENVYIYFTDFKHGRIIRMDDMTGKNWISFGTIGNGVGQFMTPEKFQIQPDGHIYIADTNGDRIVRMDDMNGKGWISYGSHGSGIGHFNQPHAIRLDSSGRIYIPDGNCRIVRIDDMTGAGWIEYGTGKQCGQSTDTIGNPFDIAFDSQGRIYTVDGTDSPRIIRIDDMTGNNRIEYGTNGTGVGQFLEPQSITFDSQGRIYVADEDKATQGGHIVRIDDMTGNGWVTFPPTDPDSRVRLPHDIMVKASGKIYIADTKNNGIVRIDDMTGKGYIEYAPYGTAQQGTDPHQLEAPKGIFIVDKK